MRPERLPSYFFDLPTYWFFFEACGMTLTVQVFFETFNSRELWVRFCVYMTCKRGEGFIDVRYFYFAVRIIRLNNLTDVRILISLRSHLSNA